MKCLISLGYGAGKDLLAKHNQCSTRFPHIFTFPTTKKGLHLDVLKADGVALMHCSAYIVTLSHTDRLNAISQLDKEYKSYAISKLNNEHLLLVKWHKASQKRLKNDECVLSV